MPHEKSQPTITDKKVRIEDHTVIPFDIVNLEFNTINDFLEFIHDGSRYLNIHVNKANWGQWLVYIHPDKEYLKMCHDDGACGLCDSKLDPKVLVEEMGNLHVDGKQVCGYCGAILRDYKSPSLVDLFNELTNKGEA